MTELKIEKVTEDSPLKAKVQRIYIKSFPLFERVSLEPFFNSVSDGVEIFALSDEEDVVAFFCTLRKGKYYYSFTLPLTKINAVRVSAVTSCPRSLRTRMVRPSS